MSQGKRLQNFGGKSEYKRMKRDETKKTNMKIKWKPKT